MFTERTPQSNVKKEKYFSVMDVSKSAECS
jgi:hypothetical protein